MNSATITVGGKEYSLLFGYTCYKLFVTRCFKFKDTYLTEGGELTMLGLSNLFHCAYLNACYSKGIDVTLGYDEISEWTDEQNATSEGQRVLVSLIEIWAKSKEVKKMAEEIEKKNQIQEMTENQILTE